ncbi:hypothetical protein [Actinoplanes siamensis]|uniref:hypothetical protein n=1 Tax=Actinoplanes siamensis TaxID=1223317 RepID=UPI001942A948|nr:hypothetical protein [Actinoplanes siamensis]
MNTYWLIGPDNTYAQVEGAARRDELASHGWTATDEPSGSDRVWMQHDVTGAISLLPAAALEPWQAKGWQHVAPPTTKTEQGYLVVLPEPGEQSPPAAATETPAVATSPADEKPSAKEQKSGR